MDIIFVKQGKYEKGGAAFPLIRKAVLCFAEENGMEPEAFDDMPAVRRTEEGRPCLEWPGHDDVDISVSHSGDLWVCLVSKGRCGVDLQTVRDKVSPGTADRYYTAGEREYTRKGGHGAFFDIWVRREALGKYGGHGFFGKYPDSAPDGMLAEHVTFSHDESGVSETVYLHGITAEMLSEAGIEEKEDFRAAAATLSDGTPGIRKMRD